MSRVCSSSYGDLWCWVICIAEHLQYFLGTPGHLSYKLLTEKEKRRAVSLWTLSRTLVTHSGLWPGDPRWIHLLQL